MNTNDTDFNAETENTSATEIELTPEQLRIIELEAALAELQAKPAPVQTGTQRVERKVYGEHKMFGTCITLGAVVYLAPASVHVSKKDQVRMNFTVEDGTVYDSEGREWVRQGENPGCGPRCPANLKATHGATWKGLTHAERREILKALTPATTAK
jgi:hypothetical protein